MTQQSPFKNTLVLRNMYFRIKIFKYLKASQLQGLSTHFQHGFSFTASKMSSNITLGWSTPSFIPKFNNGRLLLYALRMAFELN